ncbi:DUF4236 domain-containing protein [Bacillus sp. B15-48]|uniref:DUF4236 domain-containing protein n=1 Tax=Bacillus sp. B15-48 TaxID=1548601 RepID=UPI00193F57D8|nr:DUF4236 domain-containing protein [Bacillus sp. B15-48]MBM4765225.1 DUF4236 domain-containing protein [Bacillus sp. B15-48]
MAIRFRKSIKIAPGVRVNIGKRGASVSVGRRGLRHSIHSSGRKTSSVGIPGTGLSYVKTTSGKSHKSDAYKKRNALTSADQRKMEEQEDAILQVELYENHTELIRSIHHECDDPVDWHEVYNRQPPFQKGEEGPNERAAKQKLAEYKPSLLDRLFSKSERKREQLQAAVLEGVEKDAELWEDWQQTQLLANRVLAKEVEAYLEVIDEFDPLEDLIEFGSGFEFGTDDPEVIHVSFDVHAEKMIPEKSLSLTKTGRLSEKALTKTAYYDLYQDYVCSCALRIARDMFALLPITNVFVHAYEERLNSATGNQEKVAILSVKYERTLMYQLNFTNLDPSDALVHFEHQMNFKKTKGFEKVNEIMS